MATVGFASMPMTPSFVGLTKALEKELTAPMTSAAQKAGASMEKALVSSAESAAGKVEKARKKELYIARDIEAAEKKVAEAKFASEQAVRKVQEAEIARERATSKSAATLRQAEADYEKVLANSSSTADQVRKAEERVNDARLADQQTVIAEERKLEKARQDSRKEADKVRDAERKVGDERSRAEGAAKNLADAEAELAREQEGAEKSSKGLRDRLREMGDEAGDTGGMFEGLTGKVGGLVGALAGVAGVSAFAALGQGVAGEITQINNSLGLTGAAAEETSELVGQALRSGVASSAEEAGGAISALQGQFRYLGSEGEQTAGALADNFLAFARTFGIDVSEATQIAGQLITNGLAPDVESAADLMTAAMQRVPEAMRGEIGDAINEYGVNFANLGLSGQEAFSLLVGAAEGGQYQIDKTGDALKEFSVLAIDPAKAEIFESLGINAGEAAAAVAEGGEAARATLEETAQKLLDMEDPGARAAAAVELFGAPIEDLGVDKIPSFLESLVGMEDGMAGSEGASQRLADVMANSLGGRLDRLKGTVMSLAGDAFMWLWDIVEQDLIPAFQEFSGWVQDNEKWLAPLSVAVGGMAAGMTAWTLATKAFTGAQTLATAAVVAFNKASKKNIIGLIAAAVAGLVTALIWFFTETETGQAIWENFTSALASGWDWVTEKLGAGIDWIQEKFSAFTGWISDAWSGITSLFQGDYTSALSDAYGIEEDSPIIIGFFFLRDTVVGVVDWIKGAWQSLGDGLMWVYESIIRPVFDAFVTAGQYLAAIIGTVVFTPLILGWNALSAAWQFGYENIIRPVIDAFAAAGLWLWENALSPAFTWISDGFALLGEVLSAGWLWIDSVVFAPFRAGAQWLSDVFVAAIDWVSTKWTEGQELLHLGWLWIDTTVFAPFRAGAQWISDAFAAAVDWIAGKWQQGQDLLTAGWWWIDQNVFAPFRSGAQWVSDVFSAAVQWISDRWQQAQDLLHAGWRWIDENVFAPIGRGLGIVEGWFRGGVDNITSIWDGLKQKLADPINWVINFVYNDGIKRVFDGVAEKVGLDARLPEVPTIAFASGGMMPGYTPGRDVHTFYSPTAGILELSGGEPVLRPEAGRVLGKGWVDSVNYVARTQGESGVERYLTQSHFANGGLVGGRQALATGGFTNLAGGLSAVQQSHGEFVGRFFPGIFNLTSAMRPGETGSYHSTGQATDWQNPATYATQMPSPESKALAQAIHRVFPDTAELIHWPLDGWQNLLNGSPHDYGPGTNAQHANHVHWATQGPVEFDPSQSLDDIGVGFSGGSAADPEASWGFWGKILDAVPGFDLSGFGDWAQIPGAALKTMGGWVKDWAINQLKEWAGRFLDFFGSPGAGVEQWRDVAAEALRRMGYNPSDHIDAMLQQIQIESTGDPQAINMWDENAMRGTPSGGLLQVIDPTYRRVRNAYPAAFEGLPDDRFHPLTNLTAGVGAVKMDWGGPASRWPTRGGYADGGVLPDNLSHLGIYDTGGVLPRKGMAINTSPFDEVIVNGPDLQAINALANNVGALVRQLAQTGDVDAFAAALSNELEPVIGPLREQLQRLADPTSVEGITARGVATRVLDMDLLPYSSTMQSLMTVETQLMDSRAGHAARLQGIVEKEEALAQAQADLDELMSTEGEMSVQNQRKLDDAQKALDEAKADAAEASADKQAAAAEKVADAEEKLARTREDIAADEGKDAAKRDEDIAKATESVTKAEMDLADARAESVRQLDHIILPDTVGGFIPQLEMAAGVIGNHVPQVAAALTGLAATATPAGVSLGMALDAFRIALDVAREIWSVAEGLLDTFNTYRVRGAELTAESMSQIAAWTRMVDDQRQVVGELQQQLINDQIALTVATWDLRTAQFDQVRAQLEGVKNVATAEAALEAERERAARQALWDANDLHGAFDRYRWAQRIGWEQLLRDAAVVTPEILALQHEVNAARLTAESTQRQAVLNTLTATWEQHKASVALLRTQENLAIQTEQLARMSGTEFGMNTGEAIIAEEIARIAADTARIQGEKDSLGSRARGFAGSLFDWDGDGKIFGIFDNAWSQEQAGYDSAIQANNEQIARLMENEYGTLTPEQMASMEEIINRAAYQYAQGRDAAGDAIIAGSWLGDAKRAQEVVGVEQAVTGWEQDMKGLEESIADAKDLLKFEEQAQPLREIIAALQAGAESEQYRADAIREENTAVREALEALADFESEASRAIVEKRPINVTLTGDAVSTDKVRELLEELNGQQDALEFRVEQLEEPESDDALSVLDSRRRF